MKNIIIFFIVSIVIAIPARAQKMHNLYGISWELAFPTGNFVKETSFSGGKFEYRHFVKPNFSLGGTISWNNYEEYVEKQTYENANQSAAVTTDNQRFIFNLPVTVDGFYYLGGSHQMFQPYVGIGIGAQYSAQEVYYNIYVTDDNNWGFVARPQIGALVKFSEMNNTRFLIGAGYNYSTNKNESFRIDNFQNFWVSIGVSFVN